MLEPPRQDDMAIEPIRSRCDLREGHAHLKSDPSFLRQYAYRSQFADGGNHLLEKRADLRPLALEMVREIVTPAGVRLIAIREKAPALGTSPKRTLFHIPTGLSRFQPRNYSGINLFHESFRPPKRNVHFVFCAYLQLAFADSVILVVQLETRRAAFLVLPRIQFGQRFLKRSPKVSTPSRQLAIVEAK